MLMVYNPKCRSVCHDSLGWWEGWGGEGLVMVVLLEPQVLAVLCLDQFEVFGMSKYFLNQAEVNPWGGCTVAEVVLKTMSIAHQVVVVVVFETLSPAHSASFHFALQIDSSELRAVEPHPQTF